MSSRTARCHRSVMSENSIIAGCAVGCLARLLAGGACDWQEGNFIMTAPFHADTLLERLRAVTRELTPAARFEALRDVIRQGVPIGAIPAVLAVIETTLAGSLRYQAYAVWELAAVISSPEHSIMLLRYARRYTSHMARELPPAAHAVCERPPCRRNSS